MTRHTHTSACPDMRRVQVSRPRSQRSEGATLLREGLVFLLCVAAIVFGIAALGGKP